MQVKARQLLQDLGREVVAEDAPALALVELPRSCDGAVLRGFDAGR